MNWENGESVCIFVTFSVSSVLAVCCHLEQYKSNIFQDDMNSLECTLLIQYWKKQTVFVRQHRFQSWPAARPSLVAVQHKQCLVSIHKNTCHPLTQLTVLWLGKVRRKDSLVITVKQQLYQLLILVIRGKVHSASKEMWWEAHTSCPLKKKKKNTFMY